MAKRKTKKISVIVAIDSDGNYYGAGWTGMKGVVDNVLDGLTCSDPAHSAQPYVTYEVTAELTLPQTIKVRGTAKKRGKK